MFYTFKLKYRAAEGSVFFSWENLEKLYELLEKGFLDDDVDDNDDDDDDNGDFKRELEIGATVEENVEGEKVYVCEDLWALKRNETLKYTIRPKIAEKLKKTVFPTLQIGQPEEIVKEYAKLCHGDSCSPEYIKNMFDSFEFGR